jgi:hypothetical protein
MRATLTDISADLAALENLLLEVDGDVSDPEADAAVDAWFAEIGAARDQKIDDYCSLYEKLKRRGERRKKLAEADVKTAQRLRERLQYFFEAHGISKLETDSYKLSIATNGGLLPIIWKAPVEEIPDEFIEFVRKPMNPMIRELLEAGERLPFAELGERGKSIRIK